MKRPIIKILIFFTILALVGCKSKPKVIQGQTINAKIPAAQTSSFSFEDVPTKVNENLLQHEVKVEEVLNTPKYSYLRVIEGDKKYWIAVSKQDIEVGATYVHTGGLLKKNFYSKEFDRVFETVYLVSKFRKKISATGGNILESTTASNPHSERLPDLEPGEIQLAEGATALKDLFSDKEAYNGRMIKVTGKIVKLNPMIMNRNWLHLQDGTGKDLDLTVTTNQVVRLGDIVTLEGIIALDKDFGAGYRYDIILEQAEVK